MLRRSIKHGAVNQSALIVHLHLVGLLRHDAITLLQHLVLQTAGQTNHTLLLGILGQESTTFLCLGSNLGLTVGQLLVDRIGSTIGLLLQTREHTSAHLLGNRHTSHTSLLTGILQCLDSLFETSHEISHVSGVNTQLRLQIAYQALGNRHTNGIAQRVTA